MALGLGTEYPIISSNLGSGFGVYGTCDPFNGSAQNYGALNAPGSVYCIPAPSQGGNTQSWLKLSSGSYSAVTGSNGYGASLWVKYVLFKASSTPTAQTGAALVYYTDETFTTVSSAFTDGNVALTGSTSSVAGFLLPNSGTVTYGGQSIGLGTTAFTGTILNNGGLGSFVFIALAGFLPSAWVGYAAAQGAPLSSSGSGSWACAATTGVVRNVGYALTAASSSIADVQLNMPIF